MKNHPAIAPFGSWLSPISAGLLTTQSLRVSEPTFDGENIFWLETRPAEKGRNALVCLAGGERLDLLAPPYSVRTRANEYGGGAYLAVNGTVYMVLDHDQRVYRLEAATGTLQVISPEGNYRYADFCIDKHRQRLLCVRETCFDEHAEAVCEIVALALDGSSAPEVLVRGMDFYSNPRLSPDGSRLSWLCWNHPQMPWDGTACYMATLAADGSLIAEASLIAEGSVVAEGSPVTNNILINNGVEESARLIAGGVSESIFQPQWSPDGDLFFVSDRSNWWNLYRWCSNTESVEHLCELSAEFATPQWVFGMSTYGFLDRENILCCYSQKGQWQLAHINLPNKTCVPIDSGLSDISAIACHGGRGLLLGANAVSGTTLYAFDGARALLEPLIHSAQTELPRAYLSHPRAVSFATRDAEVAHGFYYPPHNPDYLGPPEQLPPLIVMCHGGPTGATESSLNLKIQFWTSRGFAVLDVNYRGSTGYGREYRDRLKNNWGITDVIDVASAADYAVNQGWVDPKKIAIRGSSAGGYTVLAALTFTDRFAVGASLYGIGNLETLARDTHKFESRYLDSLVGKYPEQASLYRARSPLFHIEKLNCPVIFLQGLRDKVVPPSQAEAMVNSLTDKGIMNAYVTFAEEGHGFRQKENIERAIEAELFFYSKVFDFPLAEPLEPVAITHWQSPLL